MKHESTGSWYDALRYTSGMRHRDLKRAIAFLTRIGIEAKESPPWQNVESFFPHCWVDRGILYYHKAKVDVGRLLHEAGHVALTPAPKRSLIEPGEIDGPSIGDLAVEAWDYYAGLAAGICPLTIFRMDFDNRGYLLCDQITKRKHLGVHILEAIGMLQNDKMLDWLMGDIDAIAELEKTLERSGLKVQSETPF